MNHSGSILIVDDEEKLRGLLKRIITLEGYQVTEAGTLRQTLKLIEKESPDIILCDVKLEDGNGVEFVSHVKSKYPSIEIILLTAYGNISDGVQAMKNGAFDYITKGDDNEKIIPLLSRAMDKIRLEKRIDQLQAQVGKQYGFENILGKSPAILDAINLAKKVAPTEAVVLLLGETGTGKEVFAQAIHAGSTRRSRAFMAINCSAFSRELLESELFGHRVGAFTGAIKDKKGLLEEANGGTLFLDELGEMPLELQAKLLRVLESGEFIKVGDVKSTRVDVRIIAATNRDLQSEVDEGKFREDLYYRLNVFIITLPALRERISDIPTIAEHFIQLFAKKTGKRIDGMSREFLGALQNHDWKGNIRELKNIIERSIILTENSELTIADLPTELQVISTTPHTSSHPHPLSAFDLASVEKLHILRVLNHTKGNKTEAARLLNIGLTTLYRKIEEYNL